MNTQKGNAMKRKILILSALLATLLSLCLASGCALALIPSLETVKSLSGDAQAAALITASAFAQSDKSLSYRLDSVTEATLTMNGIVADVEVQGSEVTVAADAKAGRDFCGYVRTRSVTSFKYAGTDYKNESTQTVGYQDGKMYIAEERKGMSLPKAIWSYATPEDYRALLSDMTGGSGETFNMLGYKTRTCTYDGEDKLFTLTLSDPSEETLAAWLESFDGLDLSIENVTLTFKIGEDFLPRSATTEIARAGGWKPITSETVYSYQNVSYDAKITLYDYAESPDLRLLYSFEKALEKVQNAREGEYTYKVDTVAYTPQGKPSSSSETDRVHFGRDEHGKFIFTIRVDDNYTVSYKDGRLTSNAPNGVPKYIDDEEARSIIDAQLNIGNFAGASFSTFKLLDGDKGRYALTVFEPDTSAYASLGTQLGGTVSSSGATFYITYRDGVLYSYRYDISLTVRKSQYQQAVTVNISATVTLQDG